MLPPASNKSLLKHVTLIGMAGVGKSTIGRIVARQMNTDLHDSDNDIELKCQASIAEIFARHGEEYFRTQEYETIASYFDGPPAIIATGGGAWIQPQLRALCQDHALNIWLKADIGTLWKNTKNRTHRPLLQGETPKERLIAMTTARDPIYALCDVAIMQDGQSKSQIAADVIAAITKEFS